jgi:cysteine desulfuration protein SufE
MHIDELIDTFELLTDWEERYRLIIDLGRKLPPLADEEKTEQHRVQGCTSQVWLIEEVQPGDPPRLRFRADSDSFIVKGLLAVILMVYSGRTPCEIIDTDIEHVFTQLGLQQNLSPNRRSGFFATVQRIKALAAQHA